MVTIRRSFLETLPARLFWALCLVLAIYLVLSAISGCGASSKGGPTLQEHEPCDIDEDCAGASEVCSAHKVCLPLSEGALSFGLELKPPETTTPESSPRLAQHELAPLDLDLTSGSVVVSMPEAVSLTGAVMVVAESPMPLEATVTLSRPSLIPGRPKVMISRSVEATGFLLRPNPQEVDPTFEVLLTRDATYTIRAQPASPYDQTFHPLVQEAKLGSDESLWLMFGDPEESIHVAGVLVDALGTGVAGVQIKAVAEAGLFLSSTGITAQDGSFHLLMPRGVRTYTVTFGPGQEGPDVPVVSRDDMVIGLQAEEQGAQNSFDHPEDLGLFQLPAYPTPQRFLFNLVGRASNGEDVVIPGAMVTFTTGIGQPSGLLGAFVTTALSGEDGVVTVNLVPGTSVENRSYDVLIVPPSDSEFAVEVLSGEGGIAVGAQGGAGPPIALLRRVAYAGQVHSAGLNPAEDLLVQARRLDGPAGIRGSLRSTTTKDEGRFSLKLDPGTYALELIPPTGLPLPRWVLPDSLLVDETTSTVVDTLSLILPSAAILEVQVVSGSSDTAAPLAGISTSVYLVDAFCAALHQQDHALCDQEPVYLGEAITDANGRARVLVPGR